MMVNNWKSVLFNEGEVIGYKDKAEAPVKDSASESTEFFIINPLKDIKGGNFLSNLAARRNILIEFDKELSPEEQWQYVQEVQLPYSLCTYSGGKSMHFIIALDQSLDENSYYYYTEILTNAIKYADTLYNPNRAARLPNAIRSSNNTRQDLIEVKNRVPLKELVKWMSLGPLFKSVDNVKKSIDWKRSMLQLKKATSKARSELGEERLSIPRIYRDMQEMGSLHPNCTSRHESLVKFGVWLSENGYSIEEIEDELHKAAVGLGVDGRRDDKNVLKWLLNKRS